MLPKLSRRYGGVNLLSSPSLVLSFIGATAAGTGMRAPPTIKSQLCSCIGDGAKVLLRFKIIYTAESVLSEQNSAPI